jgi:chromosome segregation protein
VLTELEQRLEGLEGGVQQVLRLAREDAEGKLGEVRGVVADLFHVDVDTAHLIEAALGEQAHYLVVSSAARLIEQLQRERLEIVGKVGFLRLDTRLAPSALDHVDLSAEAGVMGRADQFVESAIEFTPLVKRLLGRTWLVDRLTTALRLAESAGRGLAFVTSDGELLAADGTLVIGYRSAAAGIMSRRSELRSCHEQVSELESQLSQCTAVHVRMDEERAQQEAIVVSSVSTCGELAEALAERHRLAANARAELERVDREHQRISSELRLADERFTELVGEIQAARLQRTTAEADAAEQQARMKASRQRLHELEGRQAQLNTEFIERQLAEAKCEQRVEMLRQQWELTQRNRRDRERALAERRHRLSELCTQRDLLEQRMLTGRQELAELFLCKQLQVQQRAEHAAADELLRSERIQLLEQVRDHRQKLAAIQSQQHKLEVATSRLRHDRQTLAERMQDDYGIDLAAEAGSWEQGASSDEQEVQDSSGLRAPRSPLSAPFDRAGVEREIAQLRDQINTAGAVNLEALDELDQLESRFGTLSNQYRDLVDAKASLERIIHRINAESRQLFLATLQMVRGHFQELFRRLFGGGEADVIVDEADDVLESGIEIIARPPGKEACSISLLSGGEKTLTCVALLLAVFRSKPSPFCVLDEVDAALDEANIGRFISVLREFLSFTQFVVVTHSKKTMSGGDTLYGVTMEELGVSKQVSVRFEDVGEDGQIRPRTVPTGDNSPAGADQSKEMPMSRRAA